MLVCFCLIIRHDVKSSATDSHHLDPNHTFGTGQTEDSKTLSHSNSPLILICSVRHFLSQGSESHWHKSKDEQDGVLQGFGGIHGLFSPFLSSLWSATSFLNDACSSGHAHWIQTSPIWSLLTNFYKVWQIELLKETWPSPCFLFYHPKSYINYSFIYYHSFI